MADLEQAAPEFAQNDKSLFDVLDSFVDKMCQIGFATVKGHVKDLHVQIGKLSYSVFSKFLVAMLEHSATNVTPTNESAAAVSNRILTHLGVKDNPDATNADVTTAGQAASAPQGYSEENCKTVMATLGPFLAANVTSAKTLAEIMCHPEFKTISGEAHHVPSFLEADGHTVPVETPGAMAALLASLFAWSDNKPAQLFSQWMQLGQWLSRTSKTKWPSSASLFFNDEKLLALLCQIRGQYVIKLMEYCSMVAHCREFMSVSALQRLCRDDKEVNSKFLLRESQCVDKEQWLDFIGRSLSANVKEEILAAFEEGLANRDVVKSDPKSDSKSPVASPAPTLVDATSAATPGAQPAVSAANSDGALTSFGLVGVDLSYEKVEQGNALDFIDLMRSLHPDVESTLREAAGPS